MKRVFKTRNFARWSRKIGLLDDALCGAVSEMMRGLIDADLGGSVVKKRVSLPGRGKSGGTRTLVATNKGSKWFFVFGFEKSERANIAVGDLEAFQKIATDLLRLNAQELNGLVETEVLQEICHDSQNAS